MKNFSPLSPPSPSQKGFCRTQMYLCSRESRSILSTCIQHEIQHCDGILIIDYLSKLKKDLIIKKISKEVSNNNKIIV